MRAARAADGWQLYGARKAAAGGRAALGGDDQELVLAGDAAPEVAQGEVQHEPARAGEEEGRCQYTSCKKKWGGSGGAGGYGISTAICETTEILYISFEVSSTPGTVPGPRNPEMHRMTYRGPCVMSQQAIKMPSEVAAEPLIFC